MDESLNSAQKKAVEHLDGPMLVVAGAGTGKTKVIVERIAHLVSKGVEKKHILAITFTEKAAQEMLDRTGELLQDSYGVELNIFTFNALGQELLSEFGIEIGLNGSANLIGDNGKVVLLRENLDRLGLDYFSPISKPEGQISAIADYFSRLKQNIVRDEDYAKYASSLPASNEEEKLEKIKHQELAEAFRVYKEICRERAVIDYDDQLYLVIQLLETRPNIAKKLRERYRYVLVDEFQDTNPMQSKLIDILVGENRNVFAVGDDDQSIYGWRGATLSNILDFSNRYKNTKEVTLIENFRSTQEILDSAWKMIQENNPHRLESINNLDKKLQSYRGSGTQPKVLNFSTLDSELSWIAEDIKKTIKKGVAPGDIAILSRRTQTLNKMHQVLDYFDIDHVLSGAGSDLYRQPVVSLLIEALRAVAHPHNQTALFHTLVGQLFNCDPQLVSQASSQARSEHTDFAKVLFSSNDETINNAIKMLNSWREKIHTMSVRQLSYSILQDSGLKDLLFERANNDEQIALSIQSLGQWFQTLQDFENVTNIPSAISYLENFEALKAEGEHVSLDSDLNIDTSLLQLMTIHKAKGLEWKRVYIIDCTEGSFPLTRRNTGLIVPDSLSRSSAADDHYAEERRLMYVAVTRAKDVLFLTHSNTHNGVTKRRPSRFLNELFNDNDKQNIETYENNKVILNDSTSAHKRVSLPATLIQNDNLVLTASQVEDYIECPLNFYYRHVLCVPEPTSSSADIGSLFHACIQEINEIKITNKTMPQVEYFIEKIKNNWPKVGFISLAQSDRALKTALLAMKSTYQRIVLEPAPIAVEQKFRVHVPNSKLILRGRIDVVMPAENGVEIRDYKTSTTANTEQKAKQRATNSKQLVMYALAWKILKDEYPIYVSLDFVQTDQIGSVKKQAKTIDSMATKLAEVAENIFAGNFEAGDNHDYCIHPLI